MLTTALLAALTGLLVRLLVLLVRLVLTTTLLTALVVLLVLLSALILIILGLSYLQLECELSRYLQLPRGLVVPLLVGYTYAQARRQSLRAFSPRPW